MCQVDTIVEGFNLLQQWTKRFFESNGAVRRIFRLLELPTCYIKNQYWLMSVSKDSPSRSLKTDLIDILNFPLSHAYTVLYEEAAYSLKKIWQQSGSIMSIYTLDFLKTLWSMGNPFLPERLPLIKTVFFFFIISWNDTKLLLSN